jgi:hypothetical protein
MSSTGYKIVPHHSPPFSIPSRLQRFIEVNSGKGRIEKINKKHFQVLWFMSAQLPG